uniref:Putative secreted protein n=1 Tax=Ixodes ricinus TaxID=34613 RepID=A0A6B0UDM6_IXORI
MRCTSFLFSALCLEMAWSRNRSTSSRWLREATSDAVWKSLSSAHRLTPNETRNETQLMWPLADAQCSAVVPKWSQRSGSPPRPTSSRSASK